MAKKAKEKGKLHVLAVLDRSGSMGAIASSVISNFNEWLQTVQDSDPSAVATLVLFNDKVEVRSSAVPIGDIEPLTSANYVALGMTALYDALEEAITKHESRVSGADRALAVVITDGQENCSREINKDGLHKKIEQLSNNGWTFVYLSASPTAFADARDIGIDNGNTMSFSPTHNGVRDASVQLKASTRAYVSGGSSRTRAFWGDASSVT